MIHVHWIAAALLLAQATTPVPKPFPTGAPPTTPAGVKPGATTPTPAASPQDGGTVDPRLAGVPIYPGAELLTSFDTGRSQWVFTFGTDMPFSDIVAYYKNQLRSNGSEIFRSPQMHQFDLGPFRTDSMTYRPSVMVKDYTGTDSAGYLHVTGTTEKRYRTIVQIVPAR